MTQRADKNTNSRQPGSDAAQPGEAPTTARDREMGRDGMPQGDRGGRGKTWSPPQGAQGLSNRPNDEESRKQRSQGDRQAE